MNYLCNQSDHIDIPLTQYKSLKGFRRLFKNFKELTEDFENFFVIFKKHRGDELHIPMKANELKYSKTLGL